MPRKTKDPKLLALLDKAHRARADYERWYARLKRAFNALEKARQRIMRLQRRIDQATAQAAAPATNS
jgi:hypothetical protein